MMWWYRKQQLSLVFFYLSRLGAPENVAKQCLIEKFKAPARLHSKMGGVLAFRQVSLSV